MLIKALSERRVAEARVLIRTGADVRVISESEGVSAVDYITANEIHELYAEIGKPAIQLPLTSPTKLESARRLSNNTKPQHRVTFSATNDAIEANTTQSECSDSQPRLAAQLAAQLSALKTKAASAEKRLQRLQARNTQLVRRLKAKQQSDASCALMLKQPEDAMMGMISTLDCDIQAYSSWLVSYRKAARPLVAEIVSLIKSHISEHFPDGVRLAPSGSHANNLLMPWSDLNLTAVVGTEHRSETKRRGCIMEGARRFSRALCDMRDTVRASDMEERASLLILRLDLTARFRNARVEVIFKYYSNGAMPTSEELMDTYLAAYPLSRPLYQLLRATLHTSKLDDAAAGGLKSVALYLMVVAYLQHAPAAGDMSLAQWFINLLFFYAYTFDVYRDAICPYAVGATPHAPFGLKDARRRIHSLMVVSPYNDDIILTKSFKRSNELRQVLKLAYISLFTRCACSPLVALSVTHARNADRKDTSGKSVAYRALDRFKTVQVQCSGKASRKAPKLSLCLDADVPQPTSRSSLSIQRHNPLHNDEQLSAISRNAQPVRFRLHTLLGYGADACNNI